MAAIRRHPAAFGALGVVLTIFGLAWLLWPQSQLAVAADPGGRTPLDPVAAGQIATLRQDLALDDDVLACLDLTSPQLESLLADVRAWYEAHTAQWLAQKSALADQQALVRVLESAVNMGEDQSAALAAAQEQLATLKAQYASSMTSTRAALATGLTAPQQALIARMDANRLLAMPFRVLELTSDQQKALRAVLTRYHQRLSVAREAEERAAIHADYEQDLQTAIGAPALQALAALGAYLGPAAERVASACDLVLGAGPG